MIPHVKCARRGRTAPWWLALLLIMGVACTSTGNGGSRTGGAAAPDADRPAAHAGESSAGGTSGSGAAHRAEPRTNEEIRQWYLDQVATIDLLNARWIQEGVPAQERAHRAWSIRHEARLRSREMMPDRTEVWMLQARDFMKYGHKDGPTFEQLVEKAQEEGLQGDAVHESIIAGSQRTNKAVNQHMGAGSGGSQAPPEAAPVQNAAPAPGLPATTGPASPVPDQPRGDMR